MKPKEVRTKNDLKSAIDAKAKEIVILGDLASKVHKSKRLGRLSGWRKKAFLACMASATVALAAVPFSGGTSAPVSGVLEMGLMPTAATLSGVEIASLITIAFIGVGMLIALHKDYDEVEVSPTYLKLRRRSGK